jgi:hypothetical protein
MDYLSQISCMYCLCARVSLTWLAIASTRVSGIRVSEAMFEQREPAISLRRERLAQEEQM